MKMNNGGQHRFWQSMLKAAALLLLVTCNFAASQEHKCFENGTELRSAVTAYVGNLFQVEAVKATYGDKIGDWCVDYVEDFSITFVPDLAGSNPFVKAAYDSFNEPLDGWNTSSATNMRGMFLGVQHYNSPVNHFIVDKVWNFNSQFCGMLYNQPLTDWNTESATDMGSMFLFNHDFNHPLDHFNVKKVKDFSFMFSVGNDEPTTFNQDLCGWSRQIKNTSAQVQQMFRNSNCPVEKDPQLTRKVPGPFCHDCRDSACLRWIQRKCPCVRQTKSEDRCNRWKAKTDKYTSCGPRATKDGGCQCRLLRVDECARRAARKKCRKEMGMTWGRIRHSMKEYQRNQQCESINP